MLNEAFECLDLKSTSDEEYKTAEEGVETQNDKPIHNPSLYLLSHSELRLPKKWERSKVLDRIKFQGARCDQRYYQIIKGESL